MKKYIHDLDIFMLTIHKGCVKKNCYISLFFRISLFDVYFKYLYVNVITNYMLKTSVN